MENGHWERKSKNCWILPEVSKFVHTQWFYSLTPFLLPILLPMYIVCTDFCFSRETLLLAVSYYISKLLSKPFILISSMHNFIFLLSLPSILIETFILTLSGFHCPPIYCLQKHGPFPVLYGNYNWFFHCLKENLAFSFSSVLLIVYCCMTSYHKLSGLKQHTIY